MNLHSYHKKPIEYSDHSMICINMDLSMKSNSRAQTTTYWDLKKFRSKPQFFLNSLSKIDWSLLANFEDVDEMETFWTSEIKKCQNFTAPWKTGKINKKDIACLKKSKKKSKSGRFYRTGTKWTLITTDDFICSF